MGLDIETWGLRDYYAGEEDPNVRYVIILVEGQQLPLAVVRLTGTVEEAFTHALRWEPSDLLSRVPSEPTWVARDANVGYANGFLVEMVREIRSQMHDSELTDYKYYASFTSEVSVLDLDKLDRLIRRPEGSVEQEYAGHGSWERSDKLYRIDFGHDTHDEYVAVSTAEAAYLKDLIDARWEAGCRHYIITVDDRAVAAVVKVARDPDGSELAYTGEPEPQESRLLEQAEREPRMQAREVTMAGAVQLMAVLSLTYRSGKRAELTGGYAVFHQATDMLDLDSAYDVVKKLKRQHKIAVPVSLAEADVLTARLHLRNARREAQPIDGHFYFALFWRLGDVTDLGNAYSVIRVPANGPRQWEMLLRKGQWLRAKGPWKDHALPLTKSDLKKVTRRLDATERRYLEIRGDRGRVALLRLTGTVEETSVDLGWEPSALLQRWQNEPAWRISEDPEQGMDMARYYAARATRTEANRGGEYEYFAIFAGFAQAMDLGQTQLVVRRKEGVDEGYAGPGQWVPTDRMERIRTDPFDHSQFLPISREEMDRLTTGS